MPRTGIKNDRAARKLIEFAAGVIGQLIAAAILHACHI